jgi:hypothetical protein
MIRGGLQWIILVLHVHRPRRRGEMGAAQLQAIERFLPHLRRALRLKQSLDIEHARFATVERFCDALPKAAMLVDQHGRLVYAAQHASLLQGCDGLSLDKTGVLRAINRAEDSASAGLNKCHFSPDWRKPSRINMQVESPWNCSTNLSIVKNGQTRLTSSAACDTSSFRPSWA